MLNHDSATFQVPDGYTRTKKPLMVTVQRLGPADVLALRPGQEVHFIATDGRLRRAKVNGQVRTWKRDLERMELPLKYGMYECATLSMQEAITKLVKVIS